MAYAREPAQALVPQTFYILRELAYILYTLILYGNVPIWLFCNVYVVADNYVTIAERAGAATRRFHWL